MKAPGTGRRVAISPSAKIVGNKARAIHEKAIKSGIGPALSRMEKLVFA